MHNSSEWGAQACQNQKNYCVIEMLLNEIAKVNKMQTKTTEMP